MKISNGALERRATNHCREPLVSLTQTTCWECPVPTILTIQIKFRFCFQSWRIFGTTFRAAFKHGRLSGSTFTAAATFSCSATSAALLFFFRPLMIFKLQKIKKAFQILKRKQSASSICVARYIVSRASVCALLMIQTTNVTKKRVNGGAVKKEQAPLWHYDELLSVILKTVSFRKERFFELGSLRNSSKFLSSLQSNACLLCVIKVTEGWVGWAT